MPESNIPNQSQAQFLKKHQKQKKQITAARILIFAAFFLLWELAADVGWIDDFIFSSPRRILLCALQMSRQGVLWSHVSITLLETLISFGLVIGLSLLITTLLWLNESLSKALEPILVVLNSLPKSALAPILIVWLGANYKTIIVTGMSVAIFGSILNLYTAFLEVDASSQKLILTLGGTHKDIFFKVILPANVPNLFSIMKVDIGLCLVGVVIGEFISSRRGLGYLIIYGSQVFKLDWVILGIVILCIIAMGLYQALVLLEKRYGFHAPPKLHP